MHAVLSLSGQAGSRKSFEETKCDVGLPEFQGQERSDLPQGRGVKPSGEVLYLGAEVGDFVEKGSMLGQIDQRTPKNILDQAKSDLEASKVRLANAKSQSERGEELHLKGSISDKDYEDIQENFAQAKSTLVRTEVTFENAKINMSLILVDFLARKIVRHAAKRTPILPAKIELINISNQRLINIRIFFNSIN